MAKMLIQSESLTAIADKIRVLSGTEEPMGLDDMASNLESEKTNVESAFIAVGNKGGTIPEFKISGNLASAINSIPEGTEGGTDTSDATATADKIFLNETAYVNDKKVTGTFTIDSELNTQDDLIAQIQSALTNKASGVVLPELSNPATAENLEEGYELIDGDGNVVVGTHVCSGGGSGDGSMMYFNVINNLPDELCVNGFYCAVGESTAIPYDEMNYQKTLFLIPYQSEEYSISAPYTQIYEGDDGEMIEEGMEGVPVYSLNEDFGFVAGFLADFWPDPYTVLNNTITFEAIY